MRRSSPGTAALLGGLIVTVSAVLPARQASAEEPSIVVVVESSGSSVDAARVRRAISDALGAPAVSLLDTRARSARGVLSIVLDESGERASVQFQPHGRLDLSVAAMAVAATARDRRGEWLVSTAVSVVRASDAWATSTITDDEILDPWTAERGPYIASSDPFQLPSEVIDPFVAPGSRSPAVVEVLDPWAPDPMARPARAVVGAGRRLSPPGPGHTPRRAR